MALVAPGLPLGFPSSPQAFVSLLLSAAVSGETWSRVGGGPSGGRARGRGRSALGKAVRDFVGVCSAVWAGVGGRVGVHNFVGSPRTGDNFIFKQLGRFAGIIQTTWPFHA